MSRITIRFDAPGADTFESKFNNLAQVPDDFRPAWEAMAEAFHAHEGKVFDEEGPGWRPLARSTRWDRYYAGYPPSHPILVRTGALRASLTHPFADGAIYELYPTHMSLGSRLKTKDGYTLATLMQFGSWKVPDHPPKRPPVSITPALQRTWNQRLVTWLRDEFNYQG
ncbi:hypothetical protein [Alicyclobacillus sp. ALC3]|uniref:hypothetical protein n=1 Tax=Alicyclobacillus sp. ALC3 TaxID=2796143 RepID=UPI0023794FD3|nr:hypothetical protein [Alicyclobacillus sp. ALC3]WDL96406.1 hypothetical protein JC200_19085 [Alicyclobacillus sp. ALC3]